MSQPFVDTLASLTLDRARSRLILLGAGFVMLALWGGWLFFGKVNIYVDSTNGALESDRARYAVEATVAGRVKTVSLVLGQRVEAQDLLLELDASREMLEREEAKTQIESLKLQQEAVLKVLAAEEKALKIEMQEGKVAIWEFSKKVRKNEIVAKYFLEQEERKKRLLQGGGISEADYLKALTDAQNSEAESDISRIGRKRARFSLKARIHDRLASLETLNREIASMVGSIQVLSKKIELLENEIEKRFVRAPIGGVLAHVEKLLPGSYVQQGGPIATILAEGDLIAVAQMPASEAIGKVKAEQMARVRFHGFPWTQYGELVARVLRIADESHNGMVRIELGLQPNPDSLIPLKHGMPIDVKIEVERIPPVDLLMRIVGRSLRKETSAS